MSPSRGGLPSAQLACLLVPATWRVRGPTYCVEGGRAGCAQHDDMPRWAQPGLISSCQAPRPPGPRQLN